MIVVVRWAGLSISGASGIFTEFFCTTIAGVYRQQFEKESIQWMTVHNVWKCLVNARSEENSQSTSNNSNNNLLQLEDAEEHLWTPNMSNLEAYSSRRPQGDTFSPKRMKLNSQNWKKKIGKMLLHVTVTVYPASRHVSPPPTLNCISGRRWMEKCHLVWWVCI